MTALDLAIDDMRRALVAVEQRFKLYKERHRIAAMVRARFLATYGYVEDDVEALAVAIERGDQS